MNNINSIKNMLDKMDLNMVSHIIVQGEALKKKKIFLELNKLIIFKNKNYFIKVELENINFFTENILKEKLLTGIIIHIKKNEDYFLLNEIKIIKNYKKIVGIELYYNENYKISYIDNWLNNLKKLSINELIMTSEINNTKLKNENDIIKVFMKYKTYLNEINFQCDFIEEFRPKKCSFLDPSSNIIFFKDNKFTICTHIDNKEFKKTIDTNVNIQIDKIKKLKIELIKNRFKIYIIDKIPYNCHKCMTEATLFQKKY